MTLFSQNIVLSEQIRRNPIRNKQLRIHCKINSVSVRKLISQLLRKLCYIPELGAEVQKIAAGVLVTQ